MALRVAAPETIDAEALLRALKSVRKGDFSVRLRFKRAGTAGEIVEALNDIIEMNERLSDEIDRISDVVGKQGRIKQRASAGPVTGRWATSIASLNTLIEDLVQPTSEVARVIGAVAKGDLSQTMPLEIEGRPLRGAFREMADTVNTMVKQLGSFASEVTRVAREVGTEGKLGGQAVVRGMGGIWRDLTENVNRMASNLTGQVRNIAAVTTAVANGDLSQKITVEVQGEILQLKNTINTMVDQLRSFASEVTRVAREVGTEGKLGVQAEVKEVAGVWKDLTNNVNSMAANLTGQVRNIADVTKAVAQGDLSKKITVSVKGEILDLKDTINTMVDQLNGFAGEVTRVAREVGTEGKLGGQAQVKGVAGVWKDLTDNVNSMASNLTGQVRNIAEVTTAVANGDLSRKITVDVRGEILQLKNTINTMVDQLNGFASEVTRVAREVGFEGKLGGQAEVPGVAGVWKDLTNSVNFMAGNLTSQVRNIKDVTGAIAKGDLSRKITVDVRGEILELKDTINTMVDQLNSFASEVTRVAREVGTEGKLGGQARIKGVAGVWKDLTNNVNLMARNITNQVRNIAKVNRAIAKGDLSKKITIRARGEMADLKVTINNTVDLLNRFAGEVTRVAREVGTEGKLGGQARVKGVAGVWKDLTNNVNFMAGNLTSQVRNIADVTTAVANGDLSRKITVQVRGEILELKNTVNTMVDQLRSFASEVTRVAREVGVEGKLGGQAKVKGAAGVWKDLTNNVNSMASNLTGQVRNILEVTTAVAQGDLSKKITVDVRGEILDLKRTINTMVDRLNSFASEVTRVAREVGTEGKLGGQARVKGVAGVWKGLTENVNFMAANLTSQVRNIAEVTTGLAKGDLSKKITVEAQGEILALKNTINTTVDVLNNFAGEVTRVAREVGFEGKLGGQAQVKGVAGVWKDLTNNVNFMAGNLTGQVRNIVEVTKAVAQGDLSKKITVDVRGEILELKQTINTMVDQLNSFASEVTRVAREVGTEGKLGGQAQVKGVAGVWKGLTDNVNSMAANLTGQVRNIAEVTTAVAKGDLSKKITVEVQGEILALKDTINTMVDQLRSFASEVTRVAREVGFEGELGGQAEVKGVAGVWKDLTNNVNLMAGNLTSQVRNIADVTTAVANGDLSRKITVDVRGEILELKNTINTMVDQLRSFASEVTRVAREVGVEGKLGGQARVKGVAGVWQDLTNNVNSMAANLTSQVRNIADVTTAVARGDLSKKITVDVRGEILELKNTINTMVDQLNSFASEVTRVAREVGTEGKLGGQAQVKGVGGVWKDLTDNVNSMASNLTSQVRNIAEVTTAVANGDLSRKITVTVRGEILQLKRTINTMVDQLNSFASEVTRVAREVGTEGKLGGQAQVKGVGGVWKDLTDNVNMMAFNLTTQVRRIAKVVTAVAVGNLKQKLPLEARGEIAALADTINDMIDTLATFADQVTTVAREVGVEGKLGGQARVPGATGIWRDLTDNVNGLAANLTTQVRAIADVSTAVTKGDLSQTITVEAQGEVAALKNNINQMIRNLAQTTRLNAEQDWLKTNLARFARLLQGQRDLQAAARLTLSEMAPLVNAQIGAFYAMRDEDAKGGGGLLIKLSTYGGLKDEMPEELRIGDGLIGQVGRDKRRIIVEDARLLPTVGQVVPAMTTNLVVLPILFEGQLKGVLELASVGRFSEIHLSFLDQLGETIGIVMNTIMATQRTETLLNQSLALSRELQTRQSQLQDSNAELEDKARLLSEQKKEVETKNREIEVARSAIEEKAEQLALTSKYKSQFLANMSHELRTPLNSLLILARTLSENPDRNLTIKQVEFAQTIYASGKELLLLINDILDLSKIESGTISLEMAHVSLREIQDYVERNFRAIAEDKRLGFSVELEAGTPATIYTDAHRLKQVLRNLLSNALKFTAMGRVSLRIGEAKGGWFPQSPTLSAAKSVIAFSVTDTGIGIPSDKQKIIFEAFQQVDMTTSRKYGGTGLGLSISRKIAEMLGGEIGVESVPGKGSTFTLFVPYAYAPAVIGEPKPGAPPEEERPAAHGVPQAELPEREAPVVADDHDDVKEGDRVLLAVIGEPGVSGELLEAAHRTGFKVIVANRGEAGMTLGARRPPNAVFLDPRLPDLDGWVVFDRLKHDPRTRHIPVCLLARENDVPRAFRLGAFGVVKRPLDRSGLAKLLKRLGQFLDKESRSVLLVEESAAQRRQLADLLTAPGVRIRAVEKAQQAVAALRTQSFDCVVIDPALSDMKAAHLVQEIHGTAKTQEVPIVVDARAGLARQDEETLKRDPRVVVVKGDGTAGPVVDTVALMLHQDETRMSEAGRRAVERAQSEDPGIAGRKILIVDDDVRNIFALASLLERHRAEVIHAENGKEGLERLRSTPGIDLVLMDIMMPDMDGYEAMRAIRSMPALTSLPIIALTAKAMKGDREKCLEAGASEYVPKPVDVDLLMSLMRVWLNR